MWADRGIDFAEQVYVRPHTPAVRNHQIGGAHRDTRGVVFVHACGVQNPVGVEVEHCLEGAVDDLPSQSVPLSLQMDRDYREVPSLVIRRSPSWQGDEPRFKRRHRHKAVFIPESEDLGNVSEHPEADSIVDFFDPRLIKGPVPARELIEFRIVARARCERCAEHGWR